jgi:hypothetical protein
LDLLGKRRNEWVCMANSKVASILARVRAW